MRARLRDHEVLSKCPKPATNAGDNSFRTEIVISAEAIRAFAARLYRLDGYPVPDLQLLHLGADLDYFAGGFVSQDHRCLAKRMRPVKCVQIRPANSSGFHLYQHAVFVEVGDIKFLYHNLA